MVLLRGFSVVFRLIRMWREDNERGEGEEEVMAEGRKISEANKRKKGGRTERYMFAPMLDLWC